MIPSRLRHKASPVAFATATLFALSAHAQTEGAQERSLEEVVVTASGFEQDLKEAPASISVVTREQLQTRNFRDLAEALQDVEGIDVRGGTGKTGVGAAGRRLRFGANPKRRCLHADRTPGFARRPAGVGAQSAGVMERCVVRHRRSSRL